MIDTRAALDVTSGTFTTRFVCSWLIYIFWDQEEFDANWSLIYFLFMPYGERRTASSSRTTLVCFILPEQNIYAIESSLQVMPDCRQRLISL